MGQEIGCGIVFSVHKHKNNFYRTRSSRLNNLMGVGQTTVQELMNKLQNARVLSIECNMYFMAPGHHDTPIVSRVSYYRWIRGLEVNLLLQRNFLNIYSF